MEKDIIAILSGRSVHFSKRQRAVADYICEHPDMAAFMTAELLAQAVQRRQPGQAASGKVRPSHAG